MSRALRFFTTALVLAWSALRRNPLRGALTAFGILIGVAAVTIVVALGEGANAAIGERIDSMGDNALVVIPEETAKSGVKAGERLPPLTEDDGRALAREAAGVAAAAPLLRSFSQVAWRDANVATQIIGTSRDYFQIRDLGVASGEIWSASSQKVGAKVCLIGPTVRDELFGSEDPVGRTLRIGRHPFKVIGLLQSKGQSPFGRDMDDVVIMPAATMRAKLTPTRPGQVHRLLLSATSAGAVPQVKRQVEGILRQRHRLAEGAENDFRIRSQDDFREFQAQILGVLSMLLLSIAAVSLVVGGIGVMNIMLVSVAERTREIGIRMAIGAREADILVQFLVEAIVLCIIGGLAGTLLAGLAVAGLGKALGWSMSLSPQALAVAVAVSSGVGVLFGFVPARRAAKLDPIQALRRE